jgi:hypothetical protein
MTNPFLRNAEHCIGKVADAPASPVSKCVSSMSAIVDILLVSPFQVRRVRKTNNRNVSKNN